MFPDIYATRVSGLYTDLDIMTWQVREGSRIDEYPLIRPQDLLVIESPEGSLVFSLLKMFCTKNILDIII